MALARALARQLGRPNGPAGPLVGAILDRVNGPTNRRAVDLVDVQPGERVLDLGFGGGTGIAHLLRSTAGGQIAGVEISDAMLARARRRFRRALADRRLVLAPGSAEAIPFDDGHFDAAVTVHTIYFWPDAEAGIRELRRVLRQGENGRRSWPHRGRLIWPHLVRPRVDRFAFIEREREAGRRSAIQGGVVRADQARPRR